jgi:hypothetical protein
MTARAGVPPRGRTARPATRPDARRSASVSAVIASLRVGGPGQPVTRHTWTRTAAVISAPLISRDMKFR